MSGAAALGKDDEDVVAGPGLYCADGLVQEGAVAVGLLAQEIRADAQALCDDVCRVVEGVSLEDGEVPVEDEAVDVLLAQAGVLYRVHAGLEVEAGGRAAGYLALGRISHAGDRVLVSKCCPVHKQAFSLLMIISYSLAPAGAAFTR